MKQKMLNMLVALTAMVGSASAQTLSIASIKAEAGAQEELVVTGASLSGQTALQFNLSLPEGITLDEAAITKGTAASGHELSVSTLSSGAHLFVLYSINLDTFKDGELLRIPINIKGDGTAKLHKVRFADTNAVSHAGKDAEEILTGISSHKMVRGKSPNDECYDLSGRRVSRMTKGIYIVGGRKVVK